MNRRRDRFLLWVVASFVLSASSCSSGDTSSGGTPAQDGGTGDANAEASPTDGSSGMNGLCGSANGVPTTVAPSSGLCSTGTPTALSGTGPWTWTCAGANGGSDASCASPLESSGPVDGACGSANGQATNSAPASNLCSAGTPSPLSGNGPWAWTCEGANGGTAASCSAPVVVSGVRKPGPSQELFDSQPYYTCVENRYVATAANGGNDSNDGLTPAVGGGHGPWLTLHHAADSIPDPAPGYCINIGDGTYDISSTVAPPGGNEASQTGFSVWRAQNLLGAKLKTNSSSSDTMRVSSYTIIDGLELHGARTGSGINTCLDCCAYNGTHHIIVLNSYVHNMGENGLSFCWGEYYWAIHNRLDENAYQSWNSGVSIYEPAEIPGYTPTAYDEQWTPYHNVIAYNRCFGNFTNPSGGPHTDGNGIIYDDTQHSQNSPNTVYGPRALIMGNVAWANGGAGIQVGPGSAHADVFNNTAYNNYLDTVNDGTWRGEISCSYGMDNHYKNNIGVANPGSGILSHNAPFLGGNRVGPNSWSSNIAYGNDVYMEGGDSFPTSANMVDTDPLLVNLGAENFAIGSGSPAIGAGEVVPYWQQQTPGEIDVGACPHQLTACP